MIIHTVYGHKLSRPIIYGEIVSDAVEETRLTKFITYVIRGAGVACVLGVLGVAMVANPEAFFAAFGPSFAIALVMGLRR